MTAEPCTLAVDIGGTWIKALVLDGSGKPVGEEHKAPTPKRANPDEMLPLIHQLARKVPSHQRISVGFPGVVRKGVIYSAANLGKGWLDYRLQSALRKKLKLPVRVANDADIQGLGCIRGRGVEMVLTLGTGMGSALFLDGALVPNIEFGHHPFQGGETYETQLGLKALDEIGPYRWNQRLTKALKTLRKAFNFDRIYLGGGNARLIRTPIPEDVQLVSNRSGLLGGIALWREPRSKKASQTG